MADIKNTGGILSDIQSFRLKKAGEDDGRRQDIIHPSEMAKADWCPRATYYRIRNVRAGITPPREVFGAQLDNIFEEGNMIHAKYQGWLQDMGILWGWWICNNCGEAHMGLPNPSRHTEKCMNGDMRYLEIPLSAEETHLIAGHADGGILGRRSLLEIKSIGVGTVRMEAPHLVKEHTHKTIGGKNVLDLDGLWKSIKRPLTAHNKQGNIYLFLARQMGLPFDTMTYLYEYKATQAVKEFTVTLSERILAPLLDSALDIVYGLERGRPPVRPDFASQTASACKKCPYVAECFRPRPSAAARRRDPAADRARPASPPPAARRDRVGRRRADDAVQRANELGGVPGRPARRRDDRRESRRGGTEAG